MATKSMGTLTLFLRGDATQLIATMATVEKTMLARAAKMRSIGLSMSMYITAPLAIIGTSMAKSVMKFDDAMNKSVAIMGTQGQQMRAEMERTAIDISKTTTTTATEMAEAYFFLASAGLNAEQAIKALSVVEKFAVAGSFDMAQATTLAMDSQAALGMKSKDATINMQNLIKVTDILVGANTLANATTEQFAIALTHGAGAAMKNFGIELEDGIAILAAYADQGIKAERAGNMFSRMIRLTTAGVIRNNKQWQQFGVNIYDANNNLRPLTDLVKDLSTAFQGMSGKMIAYNLHLLGFKARSQQAIFPLLGMTEKTQDFMAALHDMGGMTKEVAEYRLQSLSSQLKIARNHLTAASLSMKESLVPVLEKLNKVLKAVGGWWESQTLAVKDATVKWSIIIALVGPGLIVLSFGMKMLTTSVVTLTGAFAGLYTMLTASLIPAFKGVGVAGAAAKTGYMGLGATTGIIWVAATAAVLSTVVAFQELYYAIFKSNEESKGFGNSLINNFEQVAIFAAHGASMIQLGILNITTFFKNGLTILTVFIFSMLEKWLWALSLIPTALGKMWGIVEDTINKAIKALAISLMKLAELVEKVLPGDQGFDFGASFVEEITVDIKIDDAMAKLGQAIDEFGGWLTTITQDAFVGMGEDYNKEVEIIGQALAQRLTEIEEQFAPVTQAAKEASEELETFNEEATEAAAERMSWWTKFWEDHWKESIQKWRDYVGKVTDLIGNMTDVAIKAFDQMGANMAEMLMGNEVDWKNFARNIIAELITLLTKALIVYAILSLFPGLTTILGTLDKPLQVAGQAAGQVQVADKMQQAGQMDNQLQPSMNTKASYGQDWMDQPFHTGGMIGRGPLKSDERVIVAQTGEVMISKDDLREGAEERNVTPEVNIINVMDKKEMISAMATPEGQKIIVNTMRRNQRVFS